MDQLMQSLAGKAPTKQTGRAFWQVSKIRSTLRRYYKKRRTAEAENQPDFHDANLKRMFPEAAPQGETRALLARLISVHRRDLAAAVNDWSGERKYMVKHVIGAIDKRARALRLVVDVPDSVAVLKLSAYITSLLMNYRHTNRLRGMHPR